MNVSFSSTSLDVVEELVAIRIAAMQESLERIGRFSPERARERLVSTFQPEFTHFILLEGQKVGFLAIKPDNGGLLLDHLYVLPDHQGNGIGSWVLAQVISEADQRNASIKVGALKESEANRFYLAHGFTMTEEGEWDIYYQRSSR